MYNRLILLFLFTSSFSSYSQRLLKNIAASDANSNINQSYTDFNNNLIKGDTLFFLAQDTTYANYYKNIWFTNGTTVNTKKVTTETGEPYPINSYIFLASFKGMVYYKDVSNSNLYATDGNTISLVKSFVYGTTIKKAGIINGWLYLFVSNSIYNTLEMWKTDGTEANTNKVTDVYNGTHNFNNNLYDASFLSTGDKIYFSFSNSYYGNEPWVTDGTAAGTRILKDINTGSGSSYPLSFEKVGNTVFFFAYVANSSVKIFKTDGTEVGTVSVADQVDGNEYYYPGSRIGYQNQLYFTANSNKLYKTDGNTVSLVKNDLVILSNGITLYDIVKMNNLLYFIRRTLNGFELWKSDGTTAGTQKIKAILINPDPESIDVRVIAGTTKVYFQLSMYRNGIFENITQHWVSDGTEEGTVNINTLNPDFSTGSYFNQLAVVGDTYYFTAYDALNGFELWKSNGTSVGTSMVKNINESITSSNPAQFVGLNNEVYFTADDVKHGRELWKTDGSTANTQLVMDMNANSNSTINYDADISGMIVYNDVIIAQVAHQLVKFNQSLPPTIFHSTSIVNPKNPEFTRFNNKIYYKGWDSGFDSMGGYELFATDGNASYKVKDFSTLYQGGDPGNFVVWGSLLYFTTHDNTKLWKSDGTEMGTVLVKDLTGGTIQSKLYVVNGVLLFAYESPDYGLELWKTNGTDAGTTLVKDLNPGSGGSNISNLAVYNNNLYFNAYSGGFYVLLKSDGTYANTQPFANVSSINVPKIFKNKLFFIGYEVSGPPYCLWSTDGNLPPVKIKQLSNEMVNATATVMTVFNDNLLVFDVLPSTARHELWASDGTTAGTQLAKVIRQKESNNYEMNISEYFNNNGKLYFAADDGTNGKELWVWDADCPEFMTITNSVSQDTVFKVDKYIVGSNKINSGIKVNYGANKYIALNPGFETKSNSVFTASMGGCINIAASASSATNEPIFKNYHTKGSIRPTIIQFLIEPSNVELQSAYLSAKNNHNEQNIAWVIDESPEKYILKMRVNGKEHIGYLPK